MRPTLSVRQFGGLLRCDKRSFDAPPRNCGHLTVWWDGDRFETPASATGCSYAGPESRTGGADRSEFAS